MDKQNYTLTQEKKQELKRIYQKKKREIIQELDKKQLIRRKRVIKNTETLVQAVYLYITEELSFQRLADYFSCRYHVHMSDTAWKKQFTKIAPIFLSTVMACCQKAEKSTETAQRHIYAIDATDFAAHGSPSTVIRVHTVLSLTDCLHFYSRLSDNHTAESVCHFPIEKGALYLADRGYGYASQLSCMIENQADFIFRISLRKIKLYQDESCLSRLDGKALLGTGETDCICYFQYQHSIYRVRLIAAPIPTEKREAAEKRVRRNACRKQSKISDSTVFFANWLILLTSLPSSVSASVILRSYSSRWQIELFFKRAKSILRFRVIRRSSASFQRTAVSLWLSIAYLLSSVLALWHPPSSLFNSFSLAMLLFA